MSHDYHTNSTSAEAKLSENDSNSEMDTSTSTLYKPKRPKFIRIVPCQVCGDDANDHNHYGGVACYSCKAFFRRKVTMNQALTCIKSDNCQVTKENRKNCKKCRLKK